MVQNNQVIASFTIKNITLNIKITLLLYATDSYKFFLFFRENHYVSLQAWYKLTKFYIDKKEFELAFNATVTMNLISFTRIDEVLSDRNIHYNFTTLSEFFVELKSYYEIDVWATEHNVWEGFYLFSQMCINMGYRDFAVEILVALATECPQREWRILAEQTLLNL